MNESIDSHIKDIADTLEELITTLDGLRESAKQQLGHQGDQTVSMYQKRVTKLINDLPTLRDNLDDNDYGDSYNI